MLAAATRCDTGSVVVIDASFPCFLFGRVCIGCSEMHDSFSVALDRGDQ